MNRLMFSDERLCMCIRSCTVLFALIAKCRVFWMMPRLTVCPGAAGCINGSHICFIEVAHKIAVIFTAFRVLSIRAANRCRSVMNTLSEMPHTTDNTKIEQKLEKCLSLYVQRTKNVRRFAGIDDFHVGIFVFIDPGTESLSNGIFDIKKFIGIM